MISKKLFKRITAIGLSAVIALSSPVTSFATEGADDSGLLTISDEGDISFDGKEITVPDENADEAGDDAGEEVTEPEIPGGEDEGLEPGSDDEYEDDAETEGEDEPDPEAEEADEEVIDVDENEEVKLLNAGTAPELTGESVWRTSATLATVKFFSDSAGTYYYKVTANEDKLGAEAIKADPSGSDVIASSGTVMISDVAGLSQGKKYVHIVVENEDEQLSAVHTIEMPYDTYYFDDFESYTEGTYINQTGRPLSPIYENHGGTGSGNQKVIFDEDLGENVLKLNGSGGNSSDQLINLSSMEVPDGSVYILEGRFKNIASSSCIRFTLMNGYYYGLNDEAGLYVIENTGRRHNSGGNTHNFGSISSDRWHNVKIIVNPDFRTYEVIVDDSLLAEDVPAPSTINYIGLSSFWSASAVFDDLKFYTTPYVRPAPEITGKSVWRTGATEATVKFYANSPGTYYYKVTNSSTAPTTGTIMMEYDGRSAATKGTVSVNVNNLTSGAKYVHIIYENARGVSDVHTIALPYDVYYYEDFDSYSESAPTVIAPISPLYRYRIGTGEPEQKITGVDENSGKALQLKCLGTNGADHLVNLSVAAQDSDACSVLEGRIYIDSSGTDESSVFRFALMNGYGYGTDAEGGIHIAGYHVYQHYQNKSAYDFGTVEPDRWYKIKIVAIPSAQKYAVYIDDVLINGDVNGPGMLNYIGITSYAKALAYFDDMEFYQTSAVTVSFNSVGGSELSEQMTAKGEHAVKPEDPVLSGYTFKQWLLGEAPFDFENTPITEDITLTADWELNVGDIIITTPSAEKIYDGTPLTCDGTGTSEIVVTGLPEGFSFTGSADGSRTDAGSGDNTLKAGYTILDSRGIDVTEGCVSHITVKPGTLTVTPKDITITTGSATKVYDGTPLTSSEVSVSGLVDGQTVSPVTEVTITDVGTVSNNYVIEWGTTNPENYAVSEALGTLTVTKAQHEEVPLTDTVPNRIEAKKRLQLPSLDPGQSFVSDNITIGGEVAALIVAGSPSIDGTELTYKTTAQDPGSEATITIPVTGGNYNDYNVIVTVSTDGLYAEFKDDIDVFTYTGAKITPEIEVYNNGEPLVVGTDYTVTYSGNINVTRDKTTGLPVAGGKVTIKGKGNLSDSKVLMFTIQPKSLIDKTDSDIEIEVGAINIASGQKVTAPVITYGSYKLTSKDYTVHDPMNGKPYTEKGLNLVVEGKGNFTGSLEIPVNVVEDKKELKKFTVVADTKTPVYFNPFADDEDMIGILSSLIKVYDSADKSKTAPLTQDTDFIITYPSDVLNAGKKSITVIGKGDYSGSVTKSITIKPLVVKPADNNGSIVVDREKIHKDGYDFKAGGVTIGEDIRVFYQIPDGNREWEMEEGIDYKIAYTNNKAVSKAGKPAEYSITFLGNYKGTPAIKNTKTAKDNVFTIITAAIADDEGYPADNFDVYTPDVAYTGKPGTYFSSPVVTLNGSTLAASNYTVKYYVKEGEELREITSKNKLTLPEGIDEALVEVQITAKGTVAGKGNYSGILKDTYKVIRQKADTVYNLSKARITIYGAGYDPEKKSNKKLSGIPFNGYQRKVTDIDPDTGEAYGTIVVDYKIGKNYVPLTEGTDYEVTYLNNINKGKAVVVINGTNTPNDDKIAFAGSKRTTFTITASSLKKYLKELLGL